MTRRSRMPLNVGLFPTFFDCDVISVWPRRGMNVEEVSVEEFSVDVQFRSFAGGSGPPISLSDRAPLDIFVLDRDTQPGGLQRPGHTASLRLAGGSGVVRLTWPGKPEQYDDGELCIVWTKGTRAAGGPPRVLTGTDASDLFDYMRDPAGRLTGSVLKLGKPIRRMPTVQVRARLRHEKEGRMANMTALPASRVSYIQVSGFRGFREASQLRLAMPHNAVGSGLTIVVGANNTGKSTLWESFDAVARKIKNDVSFSEGQRNKQSDGGIEIAISLEDGATYRLASQNAQTSETNGSWSGAPEPSKLEIVSVPSRRHFESRFSKSQTAERDWMFGGQDFGRQRQLNQGFTSRLFDLHNNPSKKSDFDKLLAKVVGYELKWTIDLGDGQHGQNYYLKIITDANVNHSSEGLGDGIISLLYILNALYDSTPATLLILDEPELSLHPQLVRRLGKVLAEFAADRQIVLFTHSPLLVSWDFIVRGAEVARVYKEGPDSKVAQVPRASIDGLSKARGGWRNPHVLGTEATEALFLDDEILVVEGQDDAGLLRKVFEEAGIPFRGTVFGWGAGGGDGNPRRILALLAGLGFKKVVALLDADKGEEINHIKAALPSFFATTIPADDIRDKPARKAFEGKAGLLDEMGRHIKAEKMEATRDTLRSVIRYFEEPTDA